MSNSSLNYPPKDNGSKGMTITFLQGCSSEADHSAKTRQKNNQKWTKKWTRRQNERPPEFPEIELGLLENRSKFIGKQ